MRFIQNPNHFALDVKSGVRDMNRWSKDVPKFRLLLLKPFLTSN